MWPLKPVIESPEDAFLPDSLELEKTSASPVARRIVWAIMVAFICSLTWSAVGQVDIISIAQGKVIPDGYSKPVQTLVAGKVNKLFVEEGEQVHQGQLLLELDNRQLLNEKENLAKQLAIILQTNRRIEQLLNLVSHLPASQSATQLASVSLERLDDIGRTRWQAFMDVIETQNQQKLRLIKAGETIHQQIQKLETLLPIISGQLKDQQRLLEKKFISRQQLLETKKTWISSQYDLNAYRSKFNENSAAINENEKTVSQSLSHFKQGLYTEKLELETQRIQLETSLESINQQLENTRLVASTSGVVQHLKVLNPEQVVTPAEILMIIVPADAQLSVEAFIENKDVGFIEEGARVEIKVEGFPFTRYGIINGVVELISADVVADNNNQAAYKAMINLATQHIAFNDKKLRLAPGMKVQAEIITGQRSVLDYFISPMVSHLQGSIHER